jgi:hypothetical protein
MVKNEMAIGYGLTQGVQAVGHVFHVATIVADAKFTLLEDTKLDFNLQEGDSW